MLAALDALYADIHSERWSEPLREAAEQLSGDAAVETDSPAMNGRHCELCGREATGGKVLQRVMNGALSVPTRLLLALAGTTDTRPPAECPLHSPQALGL